MADVTERFEQFRHRYQTEGFANPRDYFEGLDSEELVELRMLIDHFVEGLPPRAWDEAEFRASGAAELSEKVLEALTSAERLKDLRDAAEISREYLVQSLAESLGVTGGLDRVRFYYHHLEAGNLAVNRVSAAVFEALSGVLGVNVERLRRAAERSNAAAGGHEPIFARSVTGTRPGLEPVDTAQDTLAGISREDEVDRLFTGG